MSWILSLFAVTNALVVGTCRTDSRACLKVDEALEGRISGIPLRSVCLRPSGLFPSLKRRGGRAIKKMSLPIWRGRGGRSREASRNAYLKDGLGPTSPSATLLKEPSWGISRRPLLFKKGKREGSPNDGLFFRTSPGSLIFHRKANRLIEYRVDVRFRQRLIGAGPAGGREPPRYRRRVSASVAYGGRVVVFRHLRAGAE